MRRSPETRTVTNPALSQIMAWTSLLMLLTLLAVMLMTGQALAQTTHGVGEITHNIGNNVVALPRLVAVFAYVIGTFFAAAGLLKLRDWTNDSQRNSITPVLFRLVIASLLVWFPHIYVVVNNTLFGEAEQTDIPAPKFKVF